MIKRLGTAQLVLFTQRHDSTAWQQIVPSHSDNIFYALH